MSTLTKTAVAAAISCALLATVLGSAVASSGPSVVGTLPSGVDSYGAALSANGKDLWVGAYDEDEVLELDVATKSVIRTITVTDDPFGMALSHNGKQLWVTNYSGGKSVDVISTATGEILHTVTVGGDPSQIEFDPTQAIAYVTNEDDDTVSVINTSTFTVTHTIPVTGAWSVAFNKSGSRAYVLGDSSPNLSVINTKTNAVIGDISTPGADPYSVVASPDGKRLYLVSPLGPGIVTVVSTSSGEVVRTVPVGFTPYQAVVSPDSSTIYVPNYGDDTVSVISAGTLKVVSTIPLPSGSEPFTPVISSTGGLLFVTDVESEKVSVVALSAKATATVAFGGPNPVLNAGNRSILKKLVASIPKGAKKVRIRIVGYTNALSSVNLDLERAGATEYYLKSLGLKGTYTRVSGGVKSREAVVTVTYTP